MPTNYTQAAATGVFGDDDAITDTYSYEKFPLWSYREEDGKGYRFVQFDNGTGNLTPAAGLIAYFKNATATFVVTTDVSDTDRNKACGVLLGAPTDAYYCWIQTKGFCTVTTNGDDDIALGDAVIASAAGDGTADSTAQDTAPTNKVLGWAAADDDNSANTVLAFLTLD